MLKKRYTQKLFSYVVGAFVLFMLSAGIYYYIRIKKKVSAIDSLVDGARQCIDAGTLNAIDANISKISLLLISQLTFFIIALAAGAIFAMFLLRIYLIQKRNALVDPLTKIYNRRAIMFALKNEIKRSERYNNPLSIAVCDIDYFKQYNDANGHPAGDTALTKYATLLRASVREIDMVGRIGGEEFLIVMPETSLAEAKRVCERIRVSVEKTRFKGENKLPRKRLTTSIGTAQLRTRKNLSFSGKKKLLIKEADDKLYKIKESGRNAVL